MTIYAVLNQKVYPGAGDVDDCFVVATCWAARIAGVRDLPTVKEFRAAANKPDLPGPSGGSITDIMRAVNVLWPDLGVTEYERPDWDAFALALRRGKVASLGVLSSLLPSKLRFGFGGAHQIGVLFDGGYLVANPLAPQGSEPIPISETALRNAARGLAMGWILAALFPRGDAMSELALAPAAYGRVAVPKAGVQLWFSPGSNAGRKATADDRFPYVGDLTGVGDYHVVRVPGGRAAYIAHGDIARIEDAPSPTDAAYNEGRDAVVNAAASVPRR
jgi:hypothetical protein